MREAKAEMGGQCYERCLKGRRGGRLEEEDMRQKRVEQIIRCVGEEVAGNTSPLTKGKRGRERARERERQSLWPYCRALLSKNTLHTRRKPRRIICPNYARERDNTDTLIID